MGYGEFGTSSPAHEEVWYRDIPIKSQWPLESLDDPVLIHRTPPAPCGTARTGG